MADRIFITGATGFIGSRVLHCWLAETGGFATLLVRPVPGEDPAERVRRALSDLPRLEDLERRIEIIEGDLGSSGFGLDGDRLEALARSVDSIVHAAAAVDFNQPLPRARAINVGGAERVIEFARSCSSLRHLVHVSTAFVCGRRRGLVLESELDMGQEHNNSYEQSKFEAEMLLRTIGGTLPISVARPSITVCDSRTGRMPIGSPFARLMRSYARGWLPLLPGHSSARLDFVTADRVAGAISAILRFPGARGGCYHLASGPERAASLEELVSRAARHYDRPPLQIVSPDEFAGILVNADGRLSKVERRAMHEAAIHSPYLAGGVDFDTSALRAVLGAASWDPPPVGEYHARAMEFLDGRISGST